MEGLSERQYASQSGLSRGAVQKARKTGPLVLFADGSINAAASDARRGVMTDPDQQMRARGGLGAGGDGGTIGGGSVSGPGDSTSYLRSARRSRSNKRWSAELSNAALMPRSCLQRNAPRRHPSPHLLRSWLGDFRNIQYLRRLCFWRFS